MPNTIFCARHRHPKTGDQGRLKIIGQTQALYALLRVEHCVYASLSSPKLSTGHRDMKPVVSTSSNVSKDSG